MEAAFGRNLLWIGPLALLMGVGALAKGDDTSGVTVARWGCPQRWGQYPPRSAPADGSTVPGTGQPGEAATDPNARLADTAERGEAVASAAESFAPTMIGDYFAGGGGTTAWFWAGATGGPIPLPGSRVPMFKMAENTSPQPLDRVYFDYSAYQHATIDDPTRSVDSFVPGFEKTFFDGMVSFELRVPMARTLDRNFYLDHSTAYKGEIGDLGMALKIVLLQFDEFLLSGGMAVTVPTAPDTNVFTDHTAANPSIHIQNGSVHVMPFLGALWTPNCSLFGIAYMQLDFDANGDEISLDYGAGMTPFVRYRQQSAMYLDTAIGYWLPYFSGCNRVLTGLAPVFEVHVNQSLEPGEIFSDATMTYSFGGDKNGAARNYTIVDLTAGAHAKFGERFMLTAGYCVPVTCDREFNSQFRFFANYRF